MGKSKFSIAKVKVHIDNSIYCGTVKNILIWNLHSEPRKSKCNSRIPHGTNQNIPFWNLHYVPKKIEVLYVNSV